MAPLKPIADALIAAYDTATTLPPITAGAPDFSVADGYAVLHDIETRRRAQGWKAVGRKIGFTNRTIWPLRRLSADVGAYLEPHRAFCGGRQGDAAVERPGAAQDRARGGIQVEKPRAADGPRGGHPGQ